MAYPKDEDQSNVYSGFLPQNAPLSTSPSLADFKKTDLRYKRNIRILRFLSRVVSLILSAFMTGCLSYALAKYFLTRNHIIPGNAQPWPTPTTLWPSIMLLAISAVTMIMNLVTVCSYICGIDTANKTDRSATYVRYIMLALQVVAWAIGTGLFKMANTGHDLWGYSCSGSADAIQEQVQSFLDFGKLCTTQTYTWYTSIVQAGSYLLTFIILLLVLKRSSGKKKMARKMENMPIGMERGGDIELEPEYRAGAGRQYMPVATGPTDL